MDKEGLKKIYLVCRPAIVLIVSIAIVVVGIAILTNVFIHKFISPVDVNDATPVEFVISDGWGASTIAKHLYEACGEGEAGLIRNKAVFKVYVDFMGKSKELQAGKYYLSKNMDIPTIIDTLCKGGESMKVKKITIPEGTTIEGIVKILEENGMLFDSEEFLSLCKTGERFDNFDFVNNVIKAKEKDRKYALEGYLFPDTYDLYIDASSETIIFKMLSRFKDVCYSGDENSLYNKAKELGFSIDEAIALASVIEKEAVVEEDFYRVSAVFHNRMAIDMKLQSDAPLAYIFGAEKATFTQEQMQTDSLYNTYVYKGVPIGAICNPGKLAIQAAVNPDADFVSQKYLYFCLTDRKSNLNAYAKTYEEHLANVEKYKENW